MAEYIDRQAAVDALARLCKRVCQYSEKQRQYMCGACPLGDAFTVIEDDLPAADVWHVMWIPVAERLPDCDTSVLIHGSHGGVYVAKHKADGWWKLNSHDHRCSPTHWMPLPPAPKEV